MQNIWKIRPELLRPPSVIQVMAELGIACRQVGIDFYVVGAIARDIWLTSNGVSPRRMTADLDLALAVADADHYRQLRDLLLAHDRFVELSTSVFALRHQETSLVVDLMPFGAIADERWQVRLDGMGMEAISVAGFNEMATAAQIVEAGEAGDQWRVASVAGIVLLKLIAWQDRPERRGKDATDLRLLLDYYFDLLEDATLFAASNADLLELLATASTEVQASNRRVAARILGRQLGWLLHEVGLRERVRNLLRQQIEKGVDAPLILAMGGDLVAGQSLLSQVFAGFQDTSGQ